MANDTDKLKEVLNAKNDKKKKQIHPAHTLDSTMIYSWELGCIEWALKKIEVNKIPNDRLEGGFGNRMTTYLIVSDYQ